MESILTSIKKLIGITEDYKHFDTDLIIHINSVFMILSQMGIGPDNGFSISDETTTWNDYLPEDNKNFEAVKTYMYLSQIGIGPSDGFSISDETTTWEDFLPSDNKNFEAVKTYIYLKTRIVFDPPQSSSTMEAMKQTISELEWRLNVEAEQKRKEVI